METLPKHLQKYVVEQNYAKYTPVEQASWRYILRQLKAYLSVHAHECYVEGLEKTGIEIESIPRIENVSAKLQKFGWRAIPVSGFIPPAAFMELQSLGVLPVASDMRTLDHLLYTPAPDIVHEAAGHAPILVHPEFADYLRQYAQIARKAIISKEDLDMYEAIRELSDIKENPSSTPEQIKTSEAKLEKVSKGISHVSEAAELGRMNWWTAEYGLIGDIKHPKIFGAGLLSSVGEAKWCLSDKVKKIPLSVDCIKQGYDITEPQPQLFVTPDFKTLVKVLNEMAEQMAFRKGGIISVQKVIRAESVNTVELNSGIQISGVVVEAISPPHPSQEVAYLRFQGPSQLSFKEKQLLGHGTEYHEHGFGTPVGKLKKFPSVCPSQLSDSQWDSLGAAPGKTMDLEFTSGVRVTGTFNGRLEQDRKTILLSLADAKATYQDRVLFDPSWGTFDMAIGSSIPSVFGGPADRAAYGETDDFVAARVPQRKYSDDEQLFQSQYAKVREIREKNLKDQDLDRELQKVLETHDQRFKTDWLLRLESYELVSNRAKSSALNQKLLSDLQQLSQQNAKIAPMIQDGLTHAQL
ncbi:aromatic amino acid hydroxylase [Bdellovibrio sp. HCB337]|uniref:aromatic amino acid hydroxylase n=1 Tax=Bdellovibrio sp. HCB337 TaxID=3394358 RepID=UPI0039A54EC4